MAITRMEDSGRLLRLGRRCGAHRVHRNKLATSNVLNLGVNVCDCMLTAVTTLIS
jgi:hypothetical protein